jgi:hypothetical protein
MPQVLQVHSAVHAVLPVLIESAAQATPEQRRRLDAPPAVSAPPLPVSVPPVVAVPPVLELPPTPLVPPLPVTAVQKPGLLAQSQALFQQAQMREVLSSDWHR